MGSRTPEGSEGSLTRSAGNQAGGATGTVRGSCVCQAEESGLKQSAKVHEQSGDTLTFPPQEVGDGRAEGLSNKTEGMLQLHSCLRLMEHTLLSEKGHSLRGLTFVGPHCQHVSGSRSGQCRRPVGVPCVVEAGGWPMGVGSVAGSLGEGPSTL